jgi:hypothetical protein
VKNHHPDKPLPDCPAIYDGATHIGYIDQSRNGLFRAYDVTGALVGSFKTQREAVRATPGVGRG